MTLESPCFSYGEYVNGRQDDKGTDIYEGDLVYYEYGVTAFTTREVKFENSGFVAVKIKEYGDILSDRFSVLLHENGCRNIEVIGNIYCPNN